ncbi:nucleotide disphospho-sugar-binding domain-containing protein [Herpetosiphon gulosus]|uniref:4'-demethylrebeccamycin synthase n=1 Tax=Herpetosiphon gulosus TaxID=1973496 RepID=A0ABP9X0K9_9CHLR
MATIVISMFPEEGHLIPSFKLGKSLKVQGHQVYYLALADFEEYIRKQGFEYLPLFAEDFSKGFRAQQTERIANSRGRAFLKEVSQTAFYLKLFQTVREAQNPIKRSLLEIGADLCIFDGFLAPLSLMVRHAGLEVISLSININLPQAVNYPPVVTNIVPDNTPASLSKASMAWKFSGLAIKITNFLIGYNFQKKLTELATHFGFPADMVVPAALFPRLRPQLEIPELVLCPQVFDFPRPSVEQGIFYCEPSIDLDRQEAAFDWSQIDPNKPLIFCTLGSQSHIYKPSRRFFQTVIDIMRSRPDWQLIMALGQKFQAHEFANVPANVQLLQWASVEQILPRTSVMITHGGVGTIKECVYFNVPMVVFPGNRDQPGYAARVVYHELGLMGAMGKVSAQALETMLNQVIQNPNFRQRVTAMGEEFRALEAASPALELIQSKLPNTRTVAS